MPCDEKAIVRQEGDLTSVFNGGEAMAKTYDHVGDFSKLLNLLVVAVEAQSGTKIPKGMAWINYRQILAKMLVFNLATVETLARGC